MKIIVALQSIIKLLKLKTNNKRKILPPTQIINDTKLNVQFENIVFEHESNIYQTNELKVHSNTNIHYHYCTYIDKYCNKKTLMQIKQKS